MKDVTFGVKVPEELRDQINEMMKGSGLVGREFMQQLVDSYLLDQNKQAIPEMAEEVKELQAITHRINEMYLYLGTRFENMSNLSRQEKEAMDQAISENEASYKEEIQKHLDQAENVREEISELKKYYGKIEKENKELQLKFAEIKGYNENFKQLNNEYENNIQQLREKLDRLKPLQEENDKLIKSNKQLQENADTLASDLWFTKREVEKLNERLVKNKKESEGRILQLRDQHKLEKQTAILELQLKHQENIEAANAKMALMQEDYHEKLKQFIFQVENKNKEKEE